MINFRIIARALGGLMLLEALLLLACLGVAIFYGEGHWHPWLVPAGICFLLGMTGVGVGYHAHNNFNRRDGYLIVATVWIIYTAVGMLPFLLGGHTDRVAVAFFETMSGFTTTGATAFPMSTRCHTPSFFGAHSRIG